MELPHPEDPAAQVLVTEIFGIDDPSPTFVKDTVHSLANLRAGDPHAQELVTKLIQVDDPSPTFVRDALNGLRIADAPNGGTALEEQSSPDWLTDLTDSPTLPAGEKHEAGENDLMSGAVHPSGQRRKKLNDPLALSETDNDSLVCNESLNDLLKHMPFKLLGKHEIISYDLYHDPESANALPFDFFTTSTGLMIVIRHFWATDDAESEYDDEQMNEQLRKVGGVLDDNWKNCYYPRDLNPCAQWKDLEPCHVAYWRRLHAMTFPEMDGMEVDEEEL